MHITKTIDRPEQKTYKLDPRPVFLHDRPWCTQNYHWEADRFLCDP